jgi:hypothetical protein
MCDWKSTYFPRKVENRIYLAGSRRESRWICGLQDVQTSERKQSFC